MGGGAECVLFAPPHTHVFFLHPPPSHSEYAAFRVSADGELHGVGLLIAADPFSDRLVVLSPIEVKRKWGRRGGRDGLLCVGTHSHTHPPFLHQGGPAARAGILPGDRVLSIDGADTAGMDRDNAAARLRGSTGSSVTLRIASRSDPVETPTPGIARRPAVRAVRLTRERVELSPVTSALLTAHQQSNSRSPPLPVGYIRVGAFTTRAGDDVRAAVTRLTAVGAQAFILDLRDNPGGLVRSGLDVASLWLQGGAPVFSVTGRAEGAAPAVLQRVVLPGDEGGGGDAATAPPLAVLVNHGSASAAEIVAGALHDNKRATIVGSQTYGKGKIQTVYPLRDGSALFVTVARYVTPGNHVIDGRGVRPDASCRPRRGGGGGVFEGAPRLAAALPGMAALLEAGLDDDACVQAAEMVLQAKWQAGKQA